MAYTVLADALARAKERSGATSADDEYLTELLELSAGIDSDSVTHYRPFITAARWLEQNRAQQTLSEADGTKFTGLTKPIASLLALQAAYDKAQELTVPEGFEAILPGCEVCENKVAAVKRYGTRSHAPSIRP